MTFVITDIQVMNFNVQLICSWNNLTSTNKQLYWSITTKLSGFVRNQLLKWIFAECYGRCPREDIGYNTAHDLWAAHFSYQPLKTGQQNLMQNNMKCSMYIDFKGQKNWFFWNTL